jgi:hypothetical protein
MASKVIALRGEPIVDEQNTASAAILPGHLIEINAGQWRKHAGAAGAAGPWFALERDELGHDIDTAYAASDRVKAGFFASGDRVNALIPSGETVTEGAELQSDGAGRLTAGTTKPVARAAAAGTPSAASADGYRLPCIVI